MHFFAPSKTFLIGEYAVLDGGPALLLNTEPYFELSVSKADKPELIGIEPKSPAGKFYADNTDVFADYRCEFIDPHQGQGGFGASSAQFALLYQAYQALLDPRLRGDDKIHENDNNWKTLLDTYRSYAWNGEGTPPSGADVIAQSMGGEIIYWDPTTYTAEALSWPFTDIHLITVRTGHKLATHTHLKQLDLPALSPLKQASKHAYTALKSKNSAGFIQAINAANAFLTEHKLVASETLALLAKYQQQNGVLASKGCGALGADVILLVVESGYEYEPVAGNSTLEYRSD